MRIKILLLTVMVLSGCASALKRHEIAQVQVQQPINCDHAHKHIALLEQEKASSVEKISNGIASLLPTSILFNILSGEFASRKAIATGEFDQPLYMKINEIKHRCFNTAVDELSLLSSAHAK